MDDRRRILWQSLVLTILIFAVGFLLNHLFDVFRISTIQAVIQEHELDREGYNVEQAFNEQFGGQTCEALTVRIGDFQKEIRKVGEDLGSYSRFSFFRRKDYDYLKRKYFLLELQFLSLVRTANKECGQPYLPIIFFYEIDDESSERQGFILQELGKDYDSELVVLSLDIDYKDEPLLDLLLASYNVTSGPSMIIGDEVYEGLMYTGPLNATVQKFLRRADPQVSVDFNLVPAAASINKSRLITIFDSLAANESANSWARADAMLVSARLQNNGSKICESLELFDKIQSNNPKIMALKFETIASLGCGRSRAAFVKLAANEWRKDGYSWRADLLERVASGQRLHLRFEENVLSEDNKVISGYYTPILPIVPSNASGVIVGETKFIVDSTDVIVSQEDRVFRDWLGGQMASPWSFEYLRVFSERFDYNKSQLREDIGWHEGSRTQELVSVGAKHFPAVGTLVARKGARWFAHDGLGTFRFEVPLDKVAYPTTRFLREDLAVMIDTHGVNSIVPDVLRYNATVVVSDCDNPGKVYAAKFLSDRGVNVICYPDKYVYLSMGHDLSLVGSPPTTINRDYAVVGGRPLTLSENDRVVVANSTDGEYALWYYQTPYSYLEQLSKGVNLNLSYVTFTQFGQTSKLTQRARLIGAKIIAARVFSEADYVPLSNWLKESDDNKLILFHSASYPYGQLMFREFMNQTSFDDPNPVWLYD